MSSRAHADVWSCCELQPLDDTAVRQHHCRAAASDQDTNSRQEWCCQEQQRHGSSTAAEHHVACVTSHLGPCTHMCALSCVSSDTNTWAQADRTAAFHCRCRSAAIRSLSNTCCLLLLQIWSLATGALLRSVAFPAAITSVVLDHGEHTLYAAATTGAIFEVDLVGAGGAAGSSAAQGTSAAGQQQQQQGYVKLEAHSQGISSLAVSLDGEKLVSGGRRGPMDSVQPSMVLLPAAIM